MVNRCEVFLCQARSGSPGLEVMGLGKAKLGRVVG